MPFLINRPCVFTFTIEIRKTNKPPISPVVGEAENSHLWIKYSNGKEEVLVESKDSEKTENIIAGIHNALI